MSKELGRKIKLLRIKENMTQKNLAKILNISRVHMSNVENGRRGMNLEQLNTLSKYFKIDISYFVEGKENIESERIVEIIKTMFIGDKLSQEEKDNLFSKILEVYLECKENIK